MHNSAKKKKKNRGKTKGGFIIEKKRTKVQKKNQAQLSKDREREKGKEYIIVDL